MKKSLLIVFLIAVIVGGLVLVSSLNFGSARLRWRKVNPKFNLRLILYIREGVGH